MLRQQYLFPNLRRRHRVIRIRFSGGRRTFRRRRRLRGGRVAGHRVLQVRDVVHIIATAVRNVVRVIHLDRENGSTIFILIRSIQSPTG